MFRDNGSVPISHRIFESPAFVQIVRASYPRPAPLATAPFAPAVDVARQPALNVTIPTDPTMLCPARGIIFYVDLS